MLLGSKNRVAGFGLSNQSQAIWLLQIPRQMNIFEFNKTVYNPFTEMASKENLSHPGVALG